LRRQRLISYANSTARASVSSPPDASTALAEWQSARDVVGQVDDRLNDLRKYGLGVLASLLTAQGIVEVTSSTGSAYVPPLGKLAIVLASLILLSTVASIDRIQRTIQRPAATRARVLERRLGFELTEEISEYYQVRRSYNLVDLVYTSLIIGVGVFGYVILSPTPWSWTWDSVATVDVVATSLGVAFSWTIGLGDAEHFVDWNVFPTPCPHGERVDVQLTNTSGDWIEPADGNPRSLWRLIRSDGLVVEGPVWTPEYAPMFPGESRTWVREVSTLESGPYRLYVARLVRLGRKDAKWWRQQLEKEALVPLKREVIVDSIAPSTSPLPSGGSDRT
jgi:hypothetical protein